MRLKVPVRDRTADCYIFLAVVIWLLACIHPAIVLIQLPLVVFLAAKCDVKIIPALLIATLDRGNLYATIGEKNMFRLGITVGSGSILCIVVFFIVLKALLSNRYDRPTSFFAWIWVLASIPAAVISFSAKANGVVGFWSNPIMDFLVPGLYFWSILLGPTYSGGGRYLATRLLIVATIFMGLGLLHVTFVCGNVLPLCAICLFLYFASDKSRGSGKFKLLSMIALVLAVLVVTVGRYLHMQVVGAEASEMEGHVSSFSILAVCAGGFCLSFVMSCKGLGTLARSFPILMLGVTIVLVSFVIATQSGNKAKDVTADWDSLEDRFQYKLFGDRAAVWTEGWRDLITPPLVFKDLRQFVTYDPVKGPGMKLMPHNQYLTLLSRDGLWLGAVLSVFLIWIQVRAFRVADCCRQDRFIHTVLVPSGAMIYFILGIAGQTVLSANLWWDSLASIVFPGIVYGQYRYRMYRKGGVSNGPQFGGMYAYPLA